MRLAPFCLLAWLLIPPIQATPVHWTLAPTTLGTNHQPGLTGLVSGDFSYDAKTNVFSDWSFTVSGLPAPIDMLNSTITPGSSHPVGAYAIEFGLEYAPAPNFLLIRFVTFTSFGVMPLTDAGGTVRALVQVSTIQPSFGSFAVYGASTVTGQPSGNTVPEPAAGVLVLLGAIALCFWKRR